MYQVFRNVSREYYHKKYFLNTCYSCKCSDFAIKPLADLLLMLLNSFDVALQLLHVLLQHLVQVSQGLDLTPQVAVLVLKICGPQRDLVLLKNRFTFISFTTTKLLGLIC